MTAITSPIHGTGESHPAARREDGFLSDNGHHCALVFGERDAERAVVTHQNMYGRSAISPAGSAITCKREETS
ncbi:hypothetical protein ABZ379_28285 [Streptomyces canus]|uniref:hypothetical protein n=1 Tax=Streptomyces canus TaxID=58343 RepID=UPI00340DA366